MGESLSARVLAGDPRAMARAISLVEAGADAGRDLIRAIYPRTGRAHLVGVTGAPGTGKSTLVDRLVGQARQDRQRVGILAVDPSSPFTGGALLGDRVRMSAHATDAGVFIRSMATRGHLGGLAGATADAAQVLDAAGVDVVIIETVGVGQGEIEIASMADVCLLVLVPGTGDDLQAIKAGIMEIGDIFVVNKADREGADRVVQAVASSLSLAPRGAEEWLPPVMKTDALTGEGIETLWAAVARQREWAGRHRPGHRRARQEGRLRDLLSASLLREADARLPTGEFDRLVDDVEARRLDPYSAVERLVAEVLSGGPAIPDRREGGTNR